MTDKTNNQQPAAQNAPVDGSNFTPVDVTAYILALSEALKDNETAKSDLQYLLLALEAHALVIAERLGAQVVLLETEDGQFAIGLAPLQ